MFFQVLFKKRGGVSVSKFSKCLLVFLLLALVFSYSSNAVAEKRLVIGSLAEARTLDPRLDIGIYEAQRMNFLLEPLVSFTRTMQLEPRLATDWDHSDDGLKIYFTLREGVLFHHGREFTAQDVKYTFDWVLDPENDAHNRELYMDIEEIEIVNDYEVIFHLKAPNGFLINNIARMDIVPYDKGEEMGRDYQFSPVGTGPYVFDSWTRDDRFVVRAFPDYWGGAPKIDVVEFRPIPEDSARLLAFEAEEIHKYQSGVLAEEIPRLEEDPNYVVQRTPGSGYDYIGVNFKNKYLNDYRIRQAIAHLLDREGIVTHVRGGVGTPGVTSVGPEMVWFNDDLVPYDYNPERARELLAEAGYPDGGFSLRIHTAEQPPRIQVAEILEYEMGQLGINLEIVVEEWGAFIDRILYSDDYDLWILGWGGQLDPDRAVYRQFHTEGGQNWAYFSNPRLDMLVEKGRVTPGDSQESVDIYREVQAIVHRELPYIHINYTEEVGLVHPYVTGWEIHSYGGQTYLDAHLFDIEK